MLRKREQGVDLAELNAVCAGETVLAREYPTLLDFLLMTSWPEEGGARKTGSILLFCQDGYVKCRLVDNDQDLVAFWSGSTVASLLRAVETDLEAGSGDWRAQKPFTGPKKK